MTVSKKVQHSPHSTLGMRNAQTKWSNWQNVLLLRRRYEGEGGVLCLSLLQKCKWPQHFRKKKKIFIHAMQLRLSSSLHCQVKVGKNLKYETMRHFTHDSCIRNVVVIYSDSRKFRVDVGEKRSKNIFCHCKSFAISYFEIRTWAKQLKSNKRKHLSSLLLTSFTFEIVMSLMAPKIYLHKKILHMSIWLLESLAIVSSILWHLMA